MKVGGRGRITIPKALRDQYGLDKDVEIEFVAVEGGIWIQKLPSTKHPVDRLRGIMELKYSNSVDGYVEGIRGER